MTPQQKAQAALDALKKLHGKAVSASTSIASVDRTQEEYGIVKHALLAQIEPPAEDKELLWQMAHVQDKPEDESAFMVNWLRGTIKIPQTVKDRIYWSEYEKRKAPAEDELEKAIEYCKQRIEDAREIDTSIPVFAISFVETIIRAATKPCDCEGLVSVLADMIHAAENGQIDSPEIEIEGHKPKWHEVWLHYAKQALAAHKKDEK